MVQVRSLGKTFEGREIPLLRLSAAAPDADVPEVMLIAGIHPREQQPPIGMAHLVDELLTGYGKDPALTRLLKERVVWIVPMFNVDGKVYDMQHGNGTTRGADWRKNRDPNPDGTVGTDLNRNFNVRWGGNHLVDPVWKTTTDTTTSEIYEGRAPLSEPETQDLTRFIASRQGHLRVFLDLHSPLHNIYEPSYLSGPEFDRYTRLAKGIRDRQQDPYPTTELHRDEDTPPGERNGDSGLTYTWAYYTQGVYAINLEFAPPSTAKTGVRARYAPPEEIETEYTRNIRGPLLYLIESAGDLPATHPGHVTVADGAGTCDKPLDPGATITWTPPTLTGGGSYAVLVSEGGGIGVMSEYRKVPIASGFSLRVEKNAKPGDSVPMTLYVWDGEHGVTADHFHLTIAGAPAATAALTPVPAHRPLRVAVYEGPGASDGRIALIAALKKDPNVTVADITAAQIQGGGLTGYDVLVHPGGSGSKQGAALGADGRDRIRAFVRSGGGYLGVCGGSYLASDDYSWSLGILNAQVVDKQHWARGHGPVDVAPTATGKTLLGADTDKISIIYWQGPLLAPAHDPKLPAYDALATFQSEIAEHGAPKGVMPGTTAIAAATYGQGRVVCFSPHPEKTPGQESLLHHALLWIAAATAAH